MDENSILRRAQINAENFCIGLFKSYIRNANNNLLSNDLFIIIDNYDVILKENQYRFTTTITGNCILFRKR